MAILERLFGEAEAFVDHYDRCQPLLHRTSGFADLFSVRAADELIGAGRLQVPHDARMANAATGGASTAERWRDAMQGSSPEAFDPDVAVAGFDAGDTIILHALHRRVPAIDRFAFDLEREVGQQIDVNAFLTPPSARGLDPHYDHHDVTILQVDGTKRWQLWEPTVEHPLPEFAPDQFSVRGEPREITLEPGDALYIPRGWMHAASTTDAVSLHLTVGIIPIAWFEVMEGFLASLDREPSMRRALPFGFHRDPSLLLDGVADAVELVRTVIRGCDVDVVAKELSESFTSVRSTRVGRLREVVAANTTLTPEMRVAFGSQASDLVWRDAGSWQAVVGGVRVELPLRISTALDRLRDGAVVSLRDLVGDPWDERASKLVRQLFRHGMLAPAASEDAS